MEKNTVANSNQNWEGFADVFYYLGDLTWSHVKMLSLVSKGLNQICKNILARHTKFGATYLYRRQQIAVDKLTLDIQKIRTEVDKSLENQVIVEGNPIKFHAKVSFGKSLTALYLAWNASSRGGFSIIAVPTSTLTSWKTIVAEFFPSQMKGLLAKRRVLFASKPTSDFLAKDGTRMVDLQRKIFIVGNLETFYNELLICVKKTTDDKDKLRLIMKTSIKLLVQDEMHKKHNSEMTTTLSCRGIVTLRMGATDREKHNANEVAVVRSLGNLSRPNIELTIFNRSCELEDAVRVYRTWGTHVIIIVQNIYNEKVDIGPDTKSQIFQCKQYNRNKYTNFAKNGGVFIANLQAILEGHNLNHCEVLVLMLGHQAIALDRVLQLVGRAARQSAMYQNVKVIIYTRCEMMIFRSLLADIDFTGYDAIARPGLLKKLTIDGILKLTKFDRFCLFAIPTGQEYRYDDSRVMSLTVNQLAEYFLM